MSATVEQDGTKATDLEAQTILALALAVGVGDQIRVLRAYAATLAGPAAISEKQRADAAEAEVARLRDRMVAAFGEGTNETHLVEISHEHERDLSRADKAEAEVLRLTKERDEARKLSDAYYRGLDAADASAKAPREALAKAAKALKTAGEALAAKWQRPDLCCSPDDWTELSKTVFWSGIGEVMAHTMSAARRAERDALAPPNPSPTPSDK